MFVRPETTAALVIEQRDGTRWVLDEARIEPQPGATVSDRDMYAVTITPIRGRVYGPGGELFEDFNQKESVRES
mgnify:CR=1 FL=1